MQFKLLARPVLGTFLGLGLFGAASTAMAQPAYNGQPTFPQQQPQEQQRTQPQSSIFPDASFYTPPRPYMHVFAAQNTIKSAGHSSRVQTLGANLGLEFNPYLAAEARLSTGLGDDSWHVGNEKITAKQKYTYGGYLISKLPISHFATPYAFLGYNHFETEFKSSQSGTSKVSGGDFSYGAGVTLTPLPFTSFNIEYSRLYDRQNVTADSLSIGMGVSF